MSQGKHNDAGRMVRLHLTIDLPEAALPAFTHVFRLLMNLFDSAEEVVDDHSPALTSTDKQTQTATSAHATTSVVYPVQSSLRAILESWDDNILNRIAQLYGEEKGETYTRRFGSELYDLAIHKHHNLCVRLLSQYVTIPTVFLFFFFFCLLSFLSFSFSFFFFFLLLFLFPSPFSFSFFFFFFLFLFSSSFPFFLSPSSFFHGNQCLFCIASILKTAHFGLFCQKQEKTSSLVSTTIVILLLIYSG